MYNRINMLSKIATANMLSKKAERITPIVEWTPGDAETTGVGKPRYRMPYDRAMAGEFDTVTGYNPTDSGKTRFGSLKEKGSKAFTDAKGWAKKHPYKAGGVAALAVTLVGGGTTWAALSAREKKSALEKAREILEEQEKQITYAGIGAGVGGLAGAGLGYGLSNENKGRNALLAGLAGAGLGAGAGYMMA